MSDNNRKRIGLMTFSWIDNPGSVFQAYALKTVFENFGLDIAVLNYQNTTWGKYRLIRGIDVFPHGTGIWKIKDIGRWIIRIYMHNKKMCKYIKFQKQFLNITKPAVLPDDLSREIMDALIIGSDQVWNYDLPLVDECYFAGFPNAPSKRYAYAASFGKDSIDEDKKSQTAELLEQFRMISVREKSGQTLVKKLIGKEAEQVLDPSLLLTADTWEKLEKKPSKDGYVFIYLREESEELTELAQKIASQKGLHVVKVVRSQLIGIINSAIGPDEWLGYLHHADLILTNSFHGICFSVLFQKNFRVLSLKKDEWRQRSNTRLESILDSLGLMDVMLNINTFEANLPGLSEIQYDKVNEVLKRERETAYDFIKKIVDDINES